MPKSSNKSRNRSGGRPSVPSLVTQATPPIESRWSRWIFGAESAAVLACILGAATVDNMKIFYLLMAMATVIATLAVWVSSRRALAMSFCVSVLAYLLIGLSGFIIWSLHQTDNTFVNQEHEVGPLDYRLPGFATMQTVTFFDSPADHPRYIFDLKNQNGAKVSLYFTQNETLIFSFVDIFGTPRSIETPVGVDGVKLGKAALVFCEVGVGGNYSFARIYINGVQIKQGKFEFPIQLGSTAWGGNYGGSEGGVNGGSLTLASLIIYGSTLSDVDLTKLTKASAAQSGIQLPSGY